MPGAILQFTSRFRGLTTAGGRARPARGLRLCISASQASGTSTATLQQATTQLSNLLQQEGDDSELEALKLIDQCKEQGLLPAFGAGRQVPKRIYTLEELRLNKIETAMLLSPTDKTLNGVRNVLQGAAGLGLAAMVFVGHADVQQVLYVLLLATFLVTADQVGNRGGAEALLVDTFGRIINREYSKRIAYHEAGHFLVAYLLGMMPRAYTLSSLDAFLKYKALNVQAGCQFCDAPFRKEVASGTLSASTLSTVSCVALAGVVTEYLKFEQAEGGLGDIAQLDGLFRSLSFTQKKTDGEVRWAVLNVASILRRHDALLEQLAAAMASGKSIGECVTLIETNLAACDDI